MQNHYPVAPRGAGFSFSFLRFAMLLAGLFALSACGIRLPGDTDSPTELAEAVTEFRVVPTSRAFISVPSALLVLERDLGGAIEQRITLPNPTSLTGENVIMLRAQREIGRASCRERV